MAILMTILGVLLIICGVCCAFTPMATLVAAGYFIAIVLIVSGVAGIYSGFKFKLYGLNFVVSILAVILGVVALVRPGGVEAIDKVLIYLLAIWLLIRGCSSVALSLRVRKLHLGNDWIWGLIIGILGIVLGVYSFIHPAVPAIAIGLLIALYFIEEGIDIIAMSRVAKALESAISPPER